MLNYNKLKYFTVVARHLNINRAAEELYIGQPSLSTHIKELEQSLGVELFIRSNRRLILTDAGKLLYERTHTFFDREAELIQEVQNAAIQKQATLRISSLGAEIIHRLPGIIRGFQDTYPAIRVELQRMNMEPMNAALKSNVTDIGFQITSDFLSPLDYSDFNSYLLLKDSVMVAVADTHPLAGHSVVTISDLKNCSIVLLSQKDQMADHYALIKNKCRKAGFTPNVVAEYAFVEPMLTAVSTGETIAFTSSFAPLKGYDNIHLINFELDIPLELRLLWKKSNTNPAISLFVQYAKDHLDSK